MLWVVIGHAFLGKYNEGPIWETVLCNIAYSFHMPLFILVSGWLFYMTRLNKGVMFATKDGHKWSYSAIIKDKTFRLILPGLVFSIVAFALKSAFPGEMSRPVGINARDVIVSYLHPIDNPFLELWFIVTLFVYFLLTPLWEWLLTTSSSMWIGLFSLVILHFFHPMTTMLCIDRVCGFAVWFYLGLVISKENCVEKFFIKRPMLGIVIGIAIYIIGRFIDPSISTIGGIVFSFGFALLADKYVPKLFCGFRNYTYQIFLMGIFAQTVVKIVNKHVTTPYVVAYILCIFAGLYLPVVVSKVIEKINWEPLSLCVGLKSK